MSIELRIVDPANTPPAELRAVVQLLSYFMGTAEQPAPVRRAADGTRALLAAQDNPEAGETYPQGTMTDGPSAEAAFGAPLTPEAAFAASVMGNVATTAPVPVGSSPVPPPVPAVSAPQAPSSGVEVDARGLPWDARIHAKSGTGPGGVKNADGSWRAKRGLNDSALVATIEAELLAAMAAPAPAVTAGNVPTPPVPVATATVPAGSTLNPTSAPASVAAESGNVPVPPLVPTPPAPVVSAPPAPPVAAPAAPAVGGTQAKPATSDYVVLVQEITAQMGAGKLTDADVAAACAAAGVASLPTLAARLDLVSTVSAVINSIAATR